jgi:hypothetical protein
MPIFVGQIAVQAEQIPARWLLAVSCKLEKEHDHKSQFQGLVKDWECLLLNLWLSFDHFITNPATRKHVSQQTTIFP